ncbi:hypothetical protein [Hymenobacter elongatus]|uniref:Uncharacterized protein n=1 Tax=Hymenobacter elongatus TaxID=877208 RepID=A0A4Z0PFD6_9BACT|nr:hypothetical protein [Hymenobacter elongatus]TGE13827.1 hypothetical protein E5J99_18675 [Hymenobacter elongatus]
MKSYTVQVMKTWGFISIFLGLLALFFGGISLSREIGIPLAVVLIWLVACLVGGYYLIKKVAVVSMQVTLTAEALSIRATQSATERQIALTDIASFFYEDFNGNKTFRLRLQSGKKVKLAHNDTFCSDDDIEALAADFEAQVAGAAADQDAESASIRREKSFFEKPISTVMLVVVTAVISLAVGKAVFDGRSLQGN